MNFELAKRDFIRLKKEELDYIDNIAKISSKKILSENEKLEIYRSLNKYKSKLNEIIKILEKLLNYENLTRDNLKDVIIEFEIDKNYLSSLSFIYENQRNIVLEELWINPKTLKFRLTLSHIIKRCIYRGINCEIIQNNQKLIESPIYIFSGYHDASEDCYGPCFGNPDDYIYGIYDNISDSVYRSLKKEIPEKDMEEFEKDKTIIYSKRYVMYSEVRRIFNEELLNVNNKTLSDCINQTNNRIEELNYIRSPEYKEKILLDKINELYRRVKGKFIQEEILYSGNFLNIIREIYKLPNDEIVKKEKVVKNDGKNSVIVVAITQDKEYIITFQSRIKDKLIAEFPAGYIENNEDPIEATKRELKEETGYITDDLFIVDEAYTSPGIDNSITYIVVANDCIKTDEKETNGTEFLSYGLFSKKELEYLINNNIMNGAMNKLAYYNLINNVVNCSVLKKKNLNPLSEY